MGTPENMSVTQKRPSPSWTFHILIAVLGIRYYYRACIKQKSDNTLVK